VVLAPPSAARWAWPWRAGSPASSRRGSPAPGCPARAPPLAVDVRPPQGPEWGGRDGGRVTAPRIPDAAPNDPSRDSRTSPPAAGSARARVCRPAEPDGPAVPPGCGPPDRPPVLGAGRRLGRGRPEGGPAPGRRGRLFPGNAPPRRGPAGCSRAATGVAGSHPSLWEAGPPGAPGRGRPPRPASGAAWPAPPAAQWPPPGGGGGPAAGRSSCVPGEKPRWPLAAHRSAAGSRRPWRSAPRPGEPDP